jgi:hypothetical protein
LITNKGKSLVAKYMLGQIPTFGSYLALGCGAPPSTETSKTPTSYSISGSTVTVTISGGHTFRVGDKIVVQMNDSRVDGDKTVATATSTQLTFPANYTIPALTAVNDAFPGTGYAEYTAASAHRLVVGDVITTTGFTQTVFNNTDVAVYAVPSTTVFLIVEAGTGATSAGTLSTIKPTVQTGATITIQYSEKKSLDFEMLRVPITSRGLATENGIDLLVLGAEAPTQDRLSITEIGVYSAGTNNLVTGSQSGILHTFANYENWEIHNTTSTTVTDFSGTLSIDNGATIALTSEPPATYISADSSIFENAQRTLRQQRPRMYDSTVVLNGKLSYIQNVNDLETMTVDNAIGAVGNIDDGIRDNRHIHLLGQSYGFDQNSSSDEIRVAFSILYKAVSPATTPTNNPSYIGIIIEFSSERETGNTKYARLKINKTPNMTFFFI